jgi:elongation factor 2
VFDHWQVMGGDPLDPTTVAAKTMLGVRKRKGMKAEIPSVVAYSDKL